MSSTRILGERWSTDSGRCARVRARPSGCVRSLSCRTCVQTTGMTGCAKPSTGETGAALYSKADHCRPRRDRGSPERGRGGSMTRSRARDCHPRIDVGNGKPGGKRAPTAWRACHPPRLDRERRRRPRRHPELHRQDGRHDRRRATGALRVRQSDSRSVPASAASRAAG